MSIEQNYELSNLQQYQQVVRICRNENKLGYILGLWGALWRMLLDQLAAEGFLTHADFVQRPAVRLPETQVLLELLLLKNPDSFEFASTILKTNIAHRSFGEGRLYKADLSAAAGFSPTNEKMMQAFERVLAQFGNGTIRSMELVRGEPLDPNVRDSIYKYWKAIGELLGMQTLWSNGKEAQEYVNALEKQYKEPNDDQQKMRDTILQGMLDSAPYGIAQVGVLRNIYKQLFTCTVDREISKKLALDSGDAMLAFLRILPQPLKEKLYELFHKLTFSAYETAQKQGGKDDSRIYIPNEEIKEEVHAALKRGEYFQKLNDDVRKRLFVVAGLQDIKQ